MGKLGPTFGVRSSDRRRATTTRYELLGPDNNFVVDAVSSEDGFRVTVNDKRLRVKLGRTADPDVLVAQFDDKPFNVVLESVSGQTITFTIGGERMSFHRLQARTGPEVLPVASVAITKDSLLAPMPGRVVGVMAKEGAKVSKGDPLVIIESMKMETVVRSDRDGKVERLLVVDGSAVKRGQTLVKFRD
jgi:biotin carboxyl carrier protein